MWVTVHALSGLALGVLSPFGVALTLILALVLHLALDLVPHWDYTGHPGRNLWAVLDVLTALVATVALAWTLGLKSTAILAAVVSALPDLDVLDALLPGPMRRRWFPSHWQRFPHGQTTPRRGVFIQALVVGASLALVLFWPR